MLVPDYLYYLLSCTYYTNSGKLNFALSQNKNIEATKLLKSVAKNDQDDEQQADEVADLSAFLIDLISTSNKNQVTEK